MSYTNVIVKTGRDLVNFFYNVPENVCPHMAEGEAVSKIELSVYVDGMMFFSREFRFTGGDPVNTFGKVDILNLGEGEYSYRLKETVVNISRDSFDRDIIGTSEISGTFIIAEKITSSPSIGTAVTGSMAGTC